MRLQAETSQLQRGVESDLDLFGPGASWLDYRLYLFRMFGFYAPVERMLSKLPGLDDVIADASLRNNKVALLSHDLVALGVDRRDLSRLPQMSVPVVDDLSRAIGWMYVLERGTVDGKQVARRLAARLPLEIEAASAFLRCYGDDALARWQAFGNALDDYATDADASERIVAGAIDCMSRLQRWLRPTSSAQPRRLHA